MCTGRMGTTCTCRMCTGRMGTTCTCRMGTGRMGTTCTCRMCTGRMCTACTCRRSSPVTSEQGARQRSKAVESSAWPLAPVESSAPWPLAPVESSARASWTASPPRCEHSQEGAEARIFAGRSAPWPLAPPTRGRGPWPLGYAEELIPARGRDRGVVLHATDTPRVPQ